MAGTTVHAHRNVPFGGSIPDAGLIGQGPSSPVGTIRHSYRNPVLLGSIKALDVMVLATVLLVCTVLQVLGLAQAQVSALRAASIACTLAFLWFPKQDRFLDVPNIFSLRNQARYLLSPMIVCGLVGAAMLLSLGWKASVVADIWFRAWLLAVAAVASERWIGTRLLVRARNKGRLARKIAIIGDGPEAFRLAEMFRHPEGSSFDVVGIFADGARLPNGAPVTNSVADLIMGSRDKQLDAVIIAIPRVGGHEAQVERLVWRLRSVLADVYVMPQLVHGIDATVPVEVVGPVSLMVLKRRPLNDWQMVGKSAFDLMVGFAVFVALLPALLLVAALIKLESPGPILFCQPRLGFNNRHFTVFKFRSMYADKTDSMAERQTERDDPRITRVGKWIRKLSIDELPQLINVMRGEMSLVGPRPHAPHTRAAGKLLDDALAEYAIRHQVKPGITGWAQVNGSRGELVTHEDLRRRVELDLDYIQRWSMWFDIKIMFLTIMREIVSRHAF